MRETISSSVLADAEAALVALAARRGVDRSELVAALADRMTGISDVMLRVSEVAAILAVDRRTVGRYREEGYLVGVDVNPAASGRPEWRIPRSSLDAFLTQCRKGRKRAKGPVRSPAILERQNNARAAVARRKKSRPRKHLV